MNWMETMTKPSIMCDIRNCSGLTPATNARSQTPLMRSLNIELIVVAEPKVKIELKGERISQKCFFCFDNLTYATMYPNPKYFLKSEPSVPSIFSQIIRGLKSFSGSLQSFINPFINLRKLN